jgi:CheY-like chemotaxis protein
LKEKGTAQKTQKTQRTLRTTEARRLMDCKNILIIEDEPAIRQMMKDILRLEGYRVFEAGDGADGLRVLKQITPNPCVVLLDLMMPGTNGWQFLDSQRTDPELSHVPVIICSAYAESAKSVNPSGFVPKPVQLDALLGAVKAFCA